jgi:hypothetical protein
MLVVADHSKPRLSIEVKNRGTTYGLLIRKSAIEVQNLIVISPLLGAWWTANLAISYIMDNRNGDHEKLTTR